MAKRLERFMHRCVLFTYPSMTLELLVTGNCGLPADSTGSPRSPAPRRGRRCRSQQLAADTKRTHQKRHARRLATHPREPIRCDLGKSVSGVIARTRVTGKECDEGGPPPVTGSSLSTGSYREEARFNVVRRFGS